MPASSFHGDSGQYTSPMVGTPHMRRLLLRRVREHPLGALRSIAQRLRLNLAARRRLRKG